jgi:acetone carboxylase, beta subunit
MTAARSPELCYIDVGGTFTDAFIVDGDGTYATGKAPSTPGDIARGFFAAIEAAASQWGMTVDEVLPSLKVLGYGSTVVLNAILTRSGRTPGLLVTRGFESILLMERGKQTWLDLDRPSRLHPVTHRHNEPIVPRTLIRGVTGRIDGRGREVVPLDEEGARRAAAELLDAGVDAVCVCLLWSFLDDSHERRVVEICQDAARAAGREVRVVASVDVAPVIRELPRLNATVLEAYTGEIARGAFAGMQEQLAARGFTGELQIMQSTGGLAPAAHVRGVETVQSGPAGGVIGARYLGQHYGFDNIITSDVGGTSFDVGLVTEGYVNVNREPSVARMLLGVPMIEILSIGTGGGTIASIDPLTGRLEVGPASAGSEPGPVCFGRGGTRPTVTDADLVLGYLNPDFFAGGTLRLDVGAARRAVEDHVARPLGMSVEEAAEGIRTIADAKMRDTIAGLIATRGLDLSDYHLLSFGGAGPSHVAGYTEGLNLAGVLVLPFSPVFSAFGASSADYEHHYNRTVNIVVPPDAGDDELSGVAARISAAWRELGEQALDQMRREGFGASSVRFRPLAMMRYGRQLNELVVHAPSSTMDGPRDWHALVAAFEDLYERIYAVAAKYPQAGYEVLEVGLVAYVEKVRPKLRTEPLHPARPDPAAVKGSRRGWFDGGWRDMTIWDLDALRAGNEVQGPGIVEGPTLTVVVPPTCRVRLDEYRTLWMERVR